MCALSHIGMPFYIPQNRLTSFWRLLGRQPKLSNVFFIFSSFFKLIILVRSYFVLFLVVLFRFLEVLKLVLRQETRLSLQGSPLFPSLFFMLYFIEGIVLFKFGGTNYGRISLGFL